MKTPSNLPPGVTDADIEHQAGAFDEPFEPRIDGGPAFPCMPPQDTAAGSAVDYPHPHEGMTLRDYFAGKALAGLLAAGLGSAIAAKVAYRAADHMLKERIRR